MKIRFVLLFLISFLFPTGRVFALDYQIIKVPAGQTVDAYFQVNVSGEVYVKIRTEDGRNCARFWWITWPFGAIKDVGERCNFVKLPVPGILNFSVASKLRVASKGKRTLLALSADEAVASSLTLKF